MGADTLNILETRGLDLLAQVQSMLRPVREDQREVPIGVFGTAASIVAGHSYATLLVSSGARPTAIGARIQATYIDPGPTMAMSPLSTRRFVKRALVDATGMRSPDRAQLAAAFDTLCGSFR